MGKYVIDIDGENAAVDGHLHIPLEVSLCGADKKPVRVNIVADNKVIPYTEVEAYKRGYDDAKHECQDCQKIMMDTEQERVDKAYQQGLEDERNRKATCEFCEYAGNGESDEPCVRCCCGYMNMFRPKREPKQIGFGDELRSINNPNIRVCVTNVRGSKWVGIAISEVIGSCHFGSIYTDRNLDGWEKTGRNFASTLQEMMNEEF